MTDLKAVLEYTQSSILHIILQLRIFELVQVDFPQSDFSTCKRNSACLGQKGVSRQKAATQCEHHLFFFNISTYYRQILYKVWSFLPSPLHVFFSVMMFVCSTASKFIPLLIGRELQRLCESGKFMGIDGAESEDVVRS